MSPESKINPRVFSLMQLIFDTNMLNNAMKEIGYDARKMPLGKLGDSTINEVYNFNKAYLILNKLL